jgi:Protein of unknown function (DUF2917)
MDWAPTTVKTFDLGYDQILLLESHPHRRMRVLHGGVWLTEEGRTEDVFAISGEEVALHARTAALIEALGPTRVEIIDSVEPSLVKRLAGSLVAAGQRFGQLFARLRSRTTLGRAPQTV